ncbi:MAG TPA: SDR family oxidoreductase, partial [Draconibacterium sp.]|nr:SDR family oxidoreductase [Draconibacterium sp.]
LLPSMTRNKDGCIVFISSVASIYGIPCYSTYSASKIALHSLSQNINAEFTSKGICALHISPDYTESEFFRNEKITGGAYYHSENYKSVEKTVRKIIQKIIHQKTEPVLSFRGKMLRVFTALFPHWIQYYFSKSASRLIFKTY